MGGLDIYRLIYHKSQRNVGKYTIHVFLWAMNPKIITTSVETTIMTFPNAQFMVYMPYIYPRKLPSFVGK